MELGNKRALFDAVRNGGIINPVTERRNSADEKISIITSALELSGMDTSQLTHASNSLHAMDSHAGDLTGNLGATFGKVGAASELMNDYNQISGCFNVNEALGVLGELGQKLLDAMHDALDAAIDALMNSEAMQAALAAIQAAADWMAAQVAAWLAALADMEKMLRDFVDALQLDKYFNNPCFSAFVGSVASDDVLSALQELNPE